MIRELWAFNGLGTGTVDEGGKLTLSDKMDRDGIFRDYVAQADADAPFVPVAATLDGTPMRFGQPDPRTHTGWLISEARAGQGKVIALTFSAVPGTVITAAVCLEEEPAYQRAQSGPAYRQARS